MYRIYQCEWLDETGTYHLFNFDFTGISPFKRAKYLITHDRGCLDPVIISIKDISNLHRKRRVRYGD